MKTTQLFDSKERYCTPCCKVISLSSEGILCASNPDAADNEYDPWNDLGEI